MQMAHKAMSPGEGMAMKAINESDNLVPRLQEYEKWLQYYLDKGDPITSAHNSALMLAKLTGDGLVKARAQAGKAATSKPGIF